MTAENWLQETLIYLPNWKWVALTLSIVCGLFILSLGRHLLTHLKTVLQNRTKHEVFKFFLKEEIHLPLAWVICAIFWNISLHAISLPN